MSGTKVNNYAIGDDNIEALMLAMDQNVKGQGSISLTGMSTTTVPKIAAGSWIEVNGTVFKFDADETLTGSPSDGIVYIRIVPSTDTCTAEMTNTAPTWSDGKQGWYGTGGAANYRYIGGIWIKSGTSYSGKFTYQGRQLYRPAFTYTETLADEVAISVSTAELTPRFNQFRINSGEIIYWTLELEGKLNTTGDGSNFVFIEQYMVNNSSDNYIGLLIDDANNSELNYKIDPKSADRITSNTYADVTHDTGNAIWKGYNVIFETDDYTIWEHAVIVGSRIVYFRNRVLTVYFNNLVV